MKKRLAIVCLFSVLFTICFAAGALADSDITMSVGETRTLSNPYSSDGLAFFDYGWTCSDESVIGIEDLDRSGIATAKKAGTATVTAWLDGSVAVTKYGERYNSATKKWESYPYTTYESRNQKFSYNITVTGTSGGGSSGGGSSGGGTVATSGSCGANVQWNLNDNGRLTISGSGRMYDYTDCGPWPSSEVKEIWVGSGVTYIGNYAFCRCWNATQVNLPSGLTGIGEHAFFSCFALEDLFLPDISTIGKYAFSGCKKITDVLIMARLKTISDGCFAMCENLEKVTILSADTIGAYAFNECSKLKTVRIPPTVTTIYSTAFDDCSSDLTIECYSESVAHQFAEQKGYKIKFLDTPPKVTVQPQDVTVNEGETATFQVGESGATSGQWYYRKSSTAAWTAVTKNGDSPIYSVTATAQLNGYQFRCLIKNVAGSVYTDTVTLTVKSKPAITTQPGSVSVNAGAVATFKVTATGATSYQWYYRKSASGTWNIVQNNGTSATYKLTTIASHNGYQFRCLVKNSVGSVYTNTVTLTVNSKPTITAQPASVTVSAGAAATFKVTATGAPSYQWYYRKSSSDAWNIVQNNGTSATYKLTTAETHNGYQFRCLVKNSLGSLYSNTVTLTVYTKPIITAQPGNVSVSAGAVATFKVTATGATSYQWYYRKSSSGTWNIVQNNGTSATYKLTTAETHNGYQFRCLVINSRGSVYTNTVTLTVYTKPVITAQPASVTVSAGAVATFKVTAAGATSYQWFYRKSSSGTWNIVQNNGTSATYKLTTIASHNGYQFRCLVINSRGSVYTSTVTLTVNSGKPTITAQPASVKVNPGAVATFKVTASGATSYQWYYRTSSSGTWNIVKNNGTSATYKLTTIESHNGYQFRCLVKNSLGSVYTNTVTLTVYTKPVITAQPASVKVNPGAVATFKVTASGATSYQWYYRTSSSGTWNIVKNNGTSATYKLTTIESHNGYQFRCLVKNSLGSVYTNTVTLTLNTKPTITAQPASVKVNPGAVATFKVTASGATSYQWYYRKSSSGTWNIVQNNGTSATYKLTTIESHNGYQFRCLVKNSLGSVYTNTVTLTLNTKPTITAQPASVKVNPGAVATFKVTAAGATSYQWYYRKSSSGTWNIVKNNGTSATYKLTTIESHNGYQFRCLVKNSLGSVYSSTVTLTLNTKPTITAQPASVKVNPGTVATFKVTASGATSYQWYYRKSSSGTWNIVKNNGTSATYKLTTIESHNGYQFRCLVKNSLGSVYTNTVTLTLNTKPTITAQPASVKVNPGAVATFKVTASGATSYQWYYRKSSSGTWNIVKNNGTSATYKLTTIESHNGYQFRCLVENSVGSLYTNVVTLTVK